MFCLRRRDLITLLGGAAAAWPLGARAQEADRKRRIGILMTIAANDPEAQARIVVFAQALQALGWTDGRNARIDVRWSTTRSDTLKYAAELAALPSDVILAEGSEAVGPLQAATRTIPIVFVLVPDPVGQGFVDSLARPGANVTGFTLYEFGMAGKWLQLLKEIAPHVTRAAVIRDSTTTGGVGQFAAIQSMAPSLGVEAVAVNVRDPGEIERTIADFGRSANGGLIVTGSGLAMVHRELIATLAARYRLPAVYWDRAPVSAGGLISYGADLRDQYRQAAAYFDRLLKGEQPVTLPVQAPTKYELVINLKAAKALGLETPSTVLARADEVIE
jgi:putative ABC transport system substrate-binding protein